MKITMVLLALAGVVLVSYAHPTPEGGITYGAEHDQNGGVRPSVQVGHTWQSADERTKAEVHANWQRTYGGRMNGDRSHGAGFSITHKW